MVGFMVGSGNVDRLRIQVSSDVERALAAGKPVVGIETTVFVHGLPHPQNVELACELREMSLSRGVVPAIIGVLGGKIVVGMGDEEIRELVHSEAVKCGTREVPYVVGLRKNAATTVSATLRIGSKAGIVVFATGGIGGVHVGDWDVSQDILELSRTDAVIVSSGCKSILDVRKTLEFLETFQVLVVGYKTDRFPIFYEGLSEHELEHVVNSPDEIAEIYAAKSVLGIEGAVLVANPIPPEHAIPEQTVSGYISQAQAECTERGIKGKAVTPYLLSRVAELSGGKTVNANVVLLKNNLELACEIAKALQRV